MRLATCLTFGVEDAHDVAVIGFVHTGETAARQNTARESTENAHHHPLTIKRIRRFKRTLKDRFLKVSCSNRAGEAASERACVGVEGRSFSDEINSGGGERV
jgi:hypothetical protein